MSNTKNLYKIADVVGEILISNKESQNNDFLLYKEVCKRMNPSFLRLSFSKAMDQAEFMDMPVFESVRRSRQKLQKQAPLIYGVHIRNKKIKDQKIEEYREFARS